MSWEVAFALLRANPARWRNQAQQPKGARQKSFVARGSSDAPEEGISN
jgi:hypothetical protein